MVVSSSTEPADHFLRQHGVTRQVTTVYTSSQNGVAERFNRTIMDTVRSMLHHANLADSFWPLAVQAATYVRNRCPTTAVQRMTPHQAWYGYPTRPSLTTCVRLCRLIFIYPSRVVTASTSSAHAAFLVHQRRLLSSLEGLPAVRSTHTPCPHVERM